jgi:hypothetical protein
MAVLGQRGWLFAFPAFHREQTVKWLFEAICAAAWGTAVKIITENGLDADEKKRLLRRSRTRSSPGLKRTVAS